MRPSNAAIGQALSLCMYLALWTTNYQDWGFFLAQVFFDALTFPVLLLFAAFLDRNPYRIQYFITDHWHVLAFINAAAIAGRYYRHTDAYSVFLVCLLAFFINAFLYDRSKKR